MPSTSGSAARPTTPPPSRSSTGCAGRSAWMRRRRRRRRSRPWPRTSGTRPPRRWRSSSTTSTSWHPSRRARTCSPSSSVRSRGTGTSCWPAGPSPRWRSPGSRWPARSCASASPTCRSRSVSWPTSRPGAASRSNRSPAAAAGPRSPRCRRWAPPAPTRRTCGRRCSTAFPRTAGARSPSSRTPRPPRPRSRRPCSSARSTSSSSPPGSRSPRRAATAGSTSTPCGCRTWLDSCQPGEIDDARRRAAFAIAERGDQRTAVAMLARAEAWDDMARVVIDALGVSRPPIPGGVAATWLGRLPPASADGPLAKLLSAIALGHRDPATATAQLQEAAEAFRASDDMAGELAAIAQLGQVAWWQNDADPLVAVALRFLEMEARRLRGGGAVGVPGPGAGRGPRQRPGDHAGGAGPHPRRVAQRDLDGPGRRHPGGGAEPSRAPRGGDAARPCGTRGRRTPLPAARRGDPGSGRGG